MTAILGILIVLAGVAVSSTNLVLFLRGTSAVVTDQLLLGATLFRVGLVALGGAVILLGLVRGLPPTSLEKNRAADPFRKRRWAAVGVMLVIAAALRLHDLNSGLWLDEIITYVQFARMPYGSIVTTYQSENQHFLYSLLAHASLQLFGDSSWSLRLPAALFGVGGIWAIYLLGREVANTREALLSAALLAVSYTHIWFSQNARGYSGLLFFSLLSSWFFLRARRTGELRLWVLYAVAAALGVYVHITMLFVIAGQFLVYLPDLMDRHPSDWRARWIGLFAGFGLSGLLVFLLHSLVLPELLSGMGREPSAVEAWKNPLWTALELAKGMQVNFAYGGAAVAALLVCGIGVLGYWRSYPALIWLLAIPPILGTVVVVGLGHHLWPRFYFFAMGFGALVVIRGVMTAVQVAARVLRWHSSRGVLVGTGLSALMVLVSAAAVPAAYGPKQDYQAAAALVETRSQPDDAIVVAGLATFPYQELYLKDWKEVRTRAELDAVRSQAQHTWLIYTFPPVLEEMQPEIMQSVERDGRRVAQFPGSVGSGTVFVSRFDRGFAGSTDRLSTTERNEGKPIP